MRYALEGGLLWLMFWCAAAGYLAGLLTGIAL